jgi:tetratricopeptide (TPR) repeat protein
MTSPKTLPMIAVLGIAALQGPEARASTDILGQQRVPSCATLPSQPASDADHALARGQFADAERLFERMEPSEEATAGRVRALIGQARFGAALALAGSATVEHPQSAALADALGAARLARGEPVEALAALRRSIALDPCRARTHYDLSVYLNVSGMPAAAQKELDVAYRLQPMDGLIRRAWMPTQQHVSTPDSDIADLRAIESRPTQTREKRAEIESVIKALQADKRGDCELVSAVQNAEIALVPLFGQGKRMPPTGSAIEIVVNGKKRQLLVDTGASGLVLSFEAAKDLGLVPEAQATSSGVGDGGESSEFVAHLDSLKIGSLELHNCKVRVQARPHGLDVQGLFGPDTLKSLLLTFDFPHERLTTAPLPAIEANASLASNRTIAESKTDRIVPPGMADWIPVFRESESLLVPVSLGGAPQKLFVLDTGAEIGMIATDVATEITTVTAKPGDSLRGVSGVTRNVSATGPLPLSFAGYAGQVDQLTVLDNLSEFAPQGAMRASGYIGYDVLRHMSLAIDYRDSLVRVNGTVPQSSNR